MPNIRVPEEVRNGSRFLLAAFVVMLAAAPAFAAEAVTYEKDIKGIIAKRCLFCHGPKSPTMEEFHKDKEGYKKKMKGPKLDTYANLMVVVKGSDAGSLMRRLDDGKRHQGRKAGQHVSEPGERRRRACSEPGNLQEMDRQLDPEEEQGTQQGGAGSDQSP